MLIGAILAAAVTVAPPVGKEPVFLHCVGGIVTATGKTTPGHDVVIDGPRGWIDGRPYNADLWQGRAYYRLRGPITRPDAAPEPQIEFVINRRTGSYGVTTSHDVLEETLGLDGMPGVGCAFETPKF